VTEQLTREQIAQILEAQSKRDSGGAILTPSKWEYHSGEPPPQPRWCIKNILPETGAGLMAGQWGIFKTTNALDMSVSVMSGINFAGCYRVKRRGGVLYFAPEGAGQIDARLHTAAQQRGIAGKLPFALHRECPPLTDKNAADIIIQWVADAATIFKSEFDLPVALVWFDTLVTAAGYKAGEDNDAAAAQRVMNALLTIAGKTNTFVIGIDHFGKVVETGTRGSSAKEGAADTVIALLGDREIGGAVKNTRLALRKQRDGVSGFEVPFTIQIKETGRDEDDDPIAASVIDWQAPQQPTKADARWTPSMQVLRRVLMATLADGTDMRPFPDGPLVRTCNIETVRAEFHRQYPADGTDDQKTETRRKAFQRAVKGATDRELVCVREVDGVQRIWLTKPEHNDGHQAISEQP
jgi:AAA domain